MRRLQEIIKNYSLFAILLISFLIFGLILLLVFSKANIHIWINQHHNLFFDSFFKYVTHLGDGRFILTLAVILSFRKIKYGWGIILTFLTSGLLAQIFKFIFDEPRPLKYFENIYNLHLIEGVKVYTLHSFPSGHTASAFALAVCLLAISNNKFWQLIVFIYAIMVGYSRMYLSQHFLIDVWVGSIIGTLVGCFYLYYSNRLTKPWMEKSLHNIINKN